LDIVKVDALSEIIITSYHNVFLLDRWVTAHGVSFLPKKSKRTFTCAKFTLLVLERLTNLIRDKAMAPPPKKQQKLFHSFSLQMQRNAERTPEQVEADRQRMLEWQQREEKQRRAYILKCAMIGHKTLPQLARE